MANDIRIGALLEAPGGALPAIVPFNPGLFLLALNAWTGDPDVWGVERLSAYEADSAAIREVGAAIARVLAGEVGPIATELITVSRGTAPIGIDGAGRDAIRLSDGDAPKWLDVASGYANLCAAAFALREFP